MIVRQVPGNNPMMRAVGSETLEELTRSPDEPQLVVQASRSAADAAVRTLVREQLDFVWRLLRRFRVPEADLDDAAQQVFIVAARRIESITAGSERAFLYGTALRVAANVRRGARRRQKWVELTPADCAAPSGTPHDALEQRRALDVLDQVLAGLGHQLRVVFVLCELEELPAPEVSAMLGVPIGTVASRLRRAREKFRTELARMRARKSSQP